MENLPKPSVPFTQSLTFKSILIAFLMLALLIPLVLVQNLIQERGNRQQEVVSDINEKWGENVYLCGPILKIPYYAFDETTSTDPATHQTTLIRTKIVSYAYFFPETLDYKTTAKTEKRSLGPFETIIFNTDMHVSGHFAAPDFKAGDIAPGDILWDKAAVIVKTTDLKGIRDQVSIAIGGEKMPFVPVYANARDSVRGLETRVFDMTGKTPDALRFDFDISYRGSHDIALAPIGKTTSATMTSDWPSPSFSGSALPDKRNVTEKGFSASWKLLDVNRPFAQQAFGALPDLRPSAFGVNLIVPVDQYQQSERTAKYGFLVIALTFLVFFLIQTVSKIRIDVFSYAMIGLALVMFYTLLVSISEQTSFLAAYAIAGAAVIIMITLYAGTMLKNRKFQGLVGISLTALYGFIYVLVQLEDYALLIGSIGLFAILGAVMYASRKIEWN